MYLRLKDKAMDREKERAEAVKYMNLEARLEIAIQALDRISRIKPIGLKDRWLHQMIAESALMAVYGSLEPTERLPDPLL